MIERVFLGWQQPFSPLAAQWLLAQPAEALARMLVVVPTAQSGRRLHEGMLARTGALLAPKTCTPGAFLTIDGPGLAAEWVDQLAWMETLENIADWAPFSALFPARPDAGTDWASGLAREMIQLRRTLQENGLTLKSAASKLTQTVEAERWQALAELENVVEQKMKSWGFRSRTQALAAGFEIPPAVTHLVLAGIAEVPPLVERALLSWQGKLTCLIGAPENEAAAFSLLGLPLESWTSRTLAWPSEPNGSVRVTADARQQAAEALKIVCTTQTPSSQLVLGAAAAEVGAEMARTFTREGWPAFHPAETPITSGLSRCLKIWCQWLADPTLATFGTLLTLPESGILVNGKRAQKAKRLAELRDRWMILRGEDLKRRLNAKKFSNEWEQNSAMELLESVEALEKWRTDLLRKDFLGTLRRLLEILAGTGRETQETAQAMLEWLTLAEPMIARVQRGSRFWIELMLAELPAPAPLPPDGRVADVQGWLELFHEPGSHLVLCGMNEGKVPARSGGEPWLSEASRERLGLLKDSTRAGRDAYLYQAMLSARLDGGRVDVICGKSGALGESLLPSRLLLAADRADLPARVKLLFQEIEPADAGLRWQMDQAWQPRSTPAPQRLNVTSLQDYLVCPFRYYLKHAIAMRSSDTGRAEWNARDFGTVAHEVLERWGLDEQARQLENPEALHQWLSRELDQVVAEWFDKRIPLAVRIQTEALRQRFLWLARVQAAQRTEGWEIVDVERKVEIPVGEALIVAKIDRIDRHRETGRLRVLDYKTGHVEGVERAHRSKITASTALPAHYTLEDPVVHEGMERGKSIQLRWQNLQLPLYAAAVMGREKILPTPCYFTLGSTESEVAVHEWADFESADLDAAQACAVWVAARIAQNVFWPPAEKVRYDDYQILAAGREFAEMIVAPKAI